MKPKITALAITLNEEENVKRYVQSLSFADEIIFIDSNSTDTTVALAKELGVTVLQRNFDDFSTQRNFALQQAKNDWIVFFDLDEYITPELEKEIIAITKSPNDFVAYTVNRNFFFMGKRIKHGGWKNNKTIRIFNKNNCSYDGNLVNETITTIGKIGALKNRVNHYSYKNFDDYNNKLNLHSQLQAKSLFIKNKRPNLFHFFIRPYCNFWWQYACRLGFLDGKEGFILAYLNSFAVFKRYLQLWLMYRKID
ncbi:glycosyltransferase family 2 protein [Flavobacterium sp. ZT3R18]|uniref:glycosyltransferase family 2 protein n=1 Tax=Flavobacterium sp. ZT3R18 TaxID=2594429 RepID=UPI00117AD90A|nr:glycosyltransferase family 2 protein [Flavobacterium sp. ZT3R18]TRX36885.1 glycosyltransferase family 2 protein [Flavobacterium sp. ZT3R18]